MERVKNLANKAYLCYFLQKCTNAESHRKITYGNRWSLNVFITKLVYTVLLTVSYYIKIKFSYRKTDFILYFTRDP